jgi:hypothetical protein
LKEISFKNRYLSKALRKLRKRIPQIHVYGGEIVQAGQIANNTPMGRVFL